MQVFPFRYAFNLEKYVEQITHKILTRISKPFPPYRSEKSSYFLSTNSRKINLLSLLNPRHVANS